VDQRVAGRRLSPAISLSSSRVSLLGRAILRAAFFAAGSRLCRLKGGFPFQNKEDAMRRTWCITLLALGCWLSDSGAAQPPPLIHYQGRLVATNGLVNGTVGLSLRLYDSPTLGTLLYEDSNQVSVVDGLYSTTIGDGTTFGDLRDALLNIGVYLEVAVNAMPLGPRELLASAPYSILSGVRGTGNDEAGTWSVIGGGENNAVLANHGTIGGGFGNSIDSAANGASVGGGAGNSIANASPYSTVGGGSGNAVGGLYNTLGGGRENSISPPSDHGFVGGGYSNEVSPDTHYAVIAGGFGNRVLTSSTGGSVAGGGYNTVSGDVAYATVAGGYSNVAGASYALAAGRNARALHPGTFVWADSQSTSFTSTSNNQFLVRAQGGAGINSTDPFGQLDIGQRQGGTLGSSVAGFTQQLVLGGPYNVGPNAQGVKLWIGDYDNDGPIVYPIFAEDENNKVDFYLKNRPNQTTGLPTAFLDGRMGLGSESIQSLGWFAGLDYQFLISGEADSLINSNVVKLLVEAYDNDGGVVVPFALVDEDQNLDLYVQARQSPGGSPRMFFDGTFGIGVDPPSAGLHVSSPGNDSVPQAWLNQENAADYARLRFTTAGSYAKRWDIATQTNVFVIYSGLFGAEMLRLDAAGLTVNGTFVSASDRDAKESISPVDSREVLAKVVSLPIARWTYKHDAGSEHIGPMAQDFHAAFGLGGDDKHIAMVDADGIALAAIQALAKENAEIREDNERMRAELERIKQRLGL